MVAKAVGAAVRLAAAQYSPVTYAVPSLGGIECFWDGDAGRLSLTVLPSGALSHASAQALTCDVGGTSGCAFNTYVDGYWFSGILFTADQSDTTARAAVAALEPQLAISAKAAGAPPRATSVVGAWKKPVSCAALSASAGVPSAAGSPTLETTSVDSASGVEEYQPDGFYAAHKASAWFGCEWSTSAVVPAGALSHFVVEFALVAHGLTSSDFLVQRRRSRFPGPMRLSQLRIRGDRANCRVLRRQLAGVRGGPIHDCPSDADRPRPSWIAQLDPAAITRPVVTQMLAGSWWASSGAP
jgi:hypothetical protein